MEWIEEHSKAKEVWDALQRKYQKRLRVSPREYVAQYSTFRMDGTISIQDVWMHLSSLARKTIAIKPEYKHTIGNLDLRVQQLLSSLPIEYDRIRSAIDTQNQKDYEVILQLLMEREGSLTGEDMAVYSSHNTGG
jgi:hypothetical protein